MQKKPHMEKIDLPELVDQFEDYLAGPSDYVNPLMLRKIKIVLEYALDCANANIDLHAASKAVDDAFCNTPDPPQIWMEE